MENSIRLKSFVRLLVFGIVMFIIILGIVIYSSGCNSASQSKNNSDGDKSDKKEVTQTINPATTMAAIDLKTTMRKLWGEHIWWTRNIIICLVDNLPGTNETLNRVMKNQDDIGDAIKPYYGDESGKKLSTLLRSHEALAGDFIKAAKSNIPGNMTEDADKKWHANADSIAYFLSKANPNWSPDDMKMMMNDHLKLVTDEVMARIKKNYGNDIMAADKAEEEILKMADMLTDGIIKQYPERFGAASVADNIINK